MLRSDKWYKISVNMSSLREMLEADNIKGNFAVWNPDLQREYQQRLKSEWTLRILNANKTSVQAQNTIKLWKYTQYTYFSVSEKHSTLWWKVV